MVHEYENNLIAAPRYVENTVDSSSGSEVDAESVEEETKTNTAEAIPIEETKPAADSLQSMVHEYENNLIAAPRYVDYTVDSSSGSEVDAEAVEDENRTDTAEAIPIEETNPAADSKYIEDIDPKYILSRNGMRVPGVRVARCIYYFPWRRCKGTKKGAKLKCRKKTSIREEYCKWHQYQNT